MLIYCQEKYALKRDYWHHIDLTILAFSIEGASIDVLVNDPRKHICFWVPYQELITMDEFNKIPKSQRKSPLDKFYKKG